MPAERLLALRARPFGPAPGIALRSSTWPDSQVVEPFLFYVGGSTKVQLGTKLPSNIFLKMMPAEGFEPPTYGLQNRCTTTVLSRHNNNFRQIDSPRISAGASTAEVWQRTEVADYSIVV